jgi:retinol dehydrogenase-12
MAEPHTPPTAGKTALVTGCNSGIGFETAKFLCENGCHVIVHCRTPEGAEATAGKLRNRHPEASLETVAFDLGDIETVDRAGRDLLEKHKSLDVLLNNAGAVFRTRTLTRDGLEAHFGVNYLAGYVLTERLLPLLRASAGGRVVNVSSVTHRIGRIRFDDLQSERGFFWLKAYANSKLAVLCSTCNLARRMAGSRVTANTVDPGIVSTNIFLKDGTVSKKLLQPFMTVLMTPPWHGGRSHLHVTTSPALEGVTGGYYVKGKACAPSGASRNEETWDRLRAISEKILKDIL